MLALLFLLVLVPDVSGQSCSAAGNTGPCVNGACAPFGPPSTCINDPVQGEICCDNTQIVVAPVTTLPPTTLRPTTVIGVTTVVPTTCVDQINPATGVSNCAATAYLCSNSAYYSLMTTQCPRTCGRCTGTSVTTSACPDLVNPSTGVSDCPSRAYLCNDATYYSIMTTQCPRTCGRCSATATTITLSNCVDQLNPSTRVSDCPSRAYLCNEASYYSLMTSQCPRTCGRCTATATSVTSTCADLVNPSTRVSDCPSRAYLCNEASYYSLMTTQCPRTCGRCSG